MLWSPLCLDQGRLWPDPLIQLNPSFQYAGTIEDLVAEGVLHSECTRIFRAGKDKGEGTPMRLYQQFKPMRFAGRRPAGTTSSRPAPDPEKEPGVYRSHRRSRIAPWNWARDTGNRRLPDECSCEQSVGGVAEVPAAWVFRWQRPGQLFARYTGQERDEERSAIVAKPPDILLTKYGNVGATF